MTRREDCTHHRTLAVVDGLLECLDCGARGTFVPVGNEPSSARLRYHKDLGDYSDDEPLVPGDDEHPDNVVSSLCTDGYHMPVLDIDVPMEVFASSTPLHYHVFFPHLHLSWFDYRSLLIALADAGIVEEAWVEHCIARGQSLVRLPGVKRARPRKGTPIAATSQEPPF